MTNLMDLSPVLLAASCGDTVKLFDVSVEHGDPCISFYTPSAGCLVNSVKWNHTNLVVASAGEDKKISLRRTNGESVGTIPVTGADSGDNIEESILAISFGNKGSRYICSGGSSQVVRIWDLQRKRCIKWLRGHTNTITGAMYNCKDEHLASISLNGDLILHNLASGAKSAELKDPNEQVLRVLDYSRHSRHLLVTAGDDGTVHLWDTTGRSPKVSWLKQHSAPTSGISFSSDDKIIASVGLDKKLYTYDPCSRRPSSCITYEAPFSSLAFIDDDWILTAGTSNGCVVFYDIRGKPQPLTVLRACSSSEAVSSLCWQRAKAVFVDEATCKAETALLGGAIGDSILMPDPLPSVTSSSVSLSAAVSGFRHSGRAGPSAEASTLTVGAIGSESRTLGLPSAEETPQRNYLRPGGPLARLHATRSSYNFKDDMEVFSPLVDVQPITPSLVKLWDAQEGVKKDHIPIDKKPSSMLFPSSSRRSPYAEEGVNDHPIFDFKSGSTSRQDDARSFAGLTPSPSSKSEDSSITPPEAWGGEKLSDKLSLLRQSVNMPSHFGMSTSSGLTSSSMYSGLQDVSSSLSHTSMSSLTDSYLSSEKFRTKDHTLYQETSSLEFPEHLSSSFPSLSLGTKGIMGSGNLELPRTSSLTLTHREPRRTYAERISTTSGTSLSVVSPKTKKTGAGTKEDLLSNFLPRSDTSAAIETATLPAINGGMSQSRKGPQPDPQQSSNFTIQLFQRTLEETLDLFQKSIHEDMRNLHIEILRQFHMQETQMSNVMSSILENQAELMKEIKSLRKENQQLRQLL